jgi:hypothetical protein
MTHDTDGDESHMRFIRAGNAMGRRVTRPEKVVVRPMNVHGLAGLLGPVVFASSLIVLHSARPEVDWLRHYVSDFANGRLGWVFAFGTAAHGIGKPCLGRRPAAVAPTRPAARSRVMCLQ